MKERTITIPLSRIEPMPLPWHEAPYSEEAVSFYMRKYKRNEYVPPPLVWKVDDYYYVEEGAHRVRAARLAGLKELQVILID